MDEITNQESVLSIIFESTHMLVAYLDAELRFVKVNHAYASADDKEPDFFIGKKHFDLFPNEKNETIFKQVIETCEPHFSYAKPFEYEHSPERGITHWDWSLCPSKDESGRVTGAVLQLVNVTDRINAEEELRVEQKFANAILASAGALVVVLDKEGRITRFNQACEKATGYKFTEVKDRFVWDLLLIPEEVDPVKQVFNNLEETSLPSEFTNYWIAKDGSRKMIQWSNSVMTGEEGAVQFIIAVGFDVTDQKGVVDALQESEQLLAEAEKIAHLGCWNWNIVTNDLHWTDEIYRMLGFEPRSFAADFQKFVDLIHPEDRDEALAAVQAAVEDPNVAYDIEHRIVREDGTVVAVREKGEVHRDENGKPLYMIGIAQDITEQKRANADLDYSRARFMAIFGSITDAVVVADTDRKMTILNQAALDQFGYTEEELLGRPTSMLYAKPEDFKQTGKQRFNINVQGNQSAYEIEYRRKDGSIFWGETLGAKIESSDKEIFGFVGIIRDVTKRKKTEQELEMHRKNLEELVVGRTQELVDAQTELVRKERLATLGQLTATVSHELRNPLGAMRPSLYIVQRKTDPADEKLQQAIKRLDRNISRCDHIIDELLDFTRITTLEKEQIAIDDWVRKLVAEQAVPSGIKVTQDLALDGVQSTIDTHRLQRALINVIENGIQAMQEEPSRKINVENAELTVFTRDLESHIEIGVRDTGVGIPDDVLPHIFEPLFSTKGFGVGLGMPTVKQIIEQHGGNIDIQTAVGEGTTIRFLIPKQYPEPLQGVGL